MCGPRSVPPRAQSSRLVALQAPELSLVNPTPPPPKGCREPPPRHLQGLPLAALGGAPGRALRGGGSPWAPLTLQSPCITEASRWELELRADQSQGYALTHSSSPLLCGADNLLVNADLAAGPRLWAPRPPGSPDLGRCCADSPGTPTKPPAAATPPCRKRRLPTPPRIPGFGPDIPQPRGATPKMRWARRFGGNLDSRTFSTNLQPPPALFSNAYQRSP